MDAEERDARAELRNLRRLATIAHHIYGKLLRLYSDDSASVVSLIWLDIWRHFLVLHQRQ